jgi:2-C-methyl-D-erythritol 2,4-cyclodiphosphate synthase
MSDAPPPTRCGIGYDTHRLAEGLPLVLAGIELPSSRGPVAHSDGDVLCHAITDALLGAAALGDIGRHFPDTDPQWRNTSSLRFLEMTRQMLAAAGYRILNVDNVVVLDEPRLAPFIGKIRENIADSLGLNLNQISVKVKTSEGTAPELAAAHAVVLLASNSPTLPE